jgi:histidinol dehydrogenase
MMQIIKYPPQSEWNQLLQRPVAETSSLEITVGRILKAVQKSGDKALRKYTAEFDGVRLKKTWATDKEISGAGDLLSTELKEAISIAKMNIEKFHSTQIPAVDIIETMPGVRCWRRAVAIEKVGLYIPGGTAPLFSTILMLGIPAKLAGCKEIILCSPPDKEGNLHPAILYAAKLAGITKIFKAGGVQAIAAMAYGTESIPKVYKIFGPGNQYVTRAKQMVQNDGVAIDIPAGPSEVAVYADDMANPAFVAADLLSQAEHGVDSHVILVVNISAHVAMEVFINGCLMELETQLDRLPRKETARKALENSKIILVKSEIDAISILNEYAPEHLILSCNNCDEVAEKILNAGSVFLGNYSPESVGDYASGTNHTLPTNGYAKAFSGVSVDSFVKKITFQKLDQRGLENIATTVISMAEAEGLRGHAEAVKIRMK